MSLLLRRACKSPGVLWPTTILTSLRPSIEHPTEKKSSANDERPAPTGWLRGPIISPSVNSTPISSGRSKQNNSACHSKSVRQDSRTNKACLAWQAWDNASPNDELTWYADGCYGGSHSSRSYCPLPLELLSCAPVRKLIR